MFLRSPRPRFPRRGVTLVEMLVAVALLVLMMTVIVQVFTAATTAVSASRTYQELDGTLRHLDSTIRQDLQNITARLTPPLNPKDGLGYFEYIENSFADSQNEDTDDCLRFTAKAPEGQMFTGRYWPPTVPTPADATQLAMFRKTFPITIQSQYAEIIYFLRNGNLYRRVLLVVPGQPVDQSGSFTVGAFNPGTTDVVRSGWLGVNDISAHPSPNGTLAQIVPNTLGDLTNRENRYAAPRFANDFVGGPMGGPDGIPDDQNGDAIPDYWPSLYAGVFTATPFTLINEVSPPSRTSVFGLMAFPYIYPYAYSQPDPTGLKGLGWIHSPDPGRGQGTIPLLEAMNHNPLDLGDSLPIPAGTQTWWGFPTWKETQGAYWNDPLILVSSGQPNGLVPFVANTTVATGNRDLLPAMTPAFRQFPQLFNDGFGGSSRFQFAPTPAGADSTLIWAQAWEDDLIMTGVRSFDVKAYDNAFPGYVDLGWADDGRLAEPYTATAAALATLKSDWTPPVIGGVSGSPFRFYWPPFQTNQWLDATTIYTNSMAHEGRIPPLSTDFRPDYQTKSGNVGDDNPDVIRLRRTWDTWSTDYSYAPASGVNPTTGTPWGPPYSGGAVYPSYPPPYEAPLRGIQIQIRVVDPRNERLKTLTIRQDFSDKL